MNDPQDLGLDALGQRVQAMSDPVSEPRPRPFLGAPLPIGPATGGRPIPAFEAFESLRTTPISSQTPAPPYPPAHEQEGATGPIPPQPQPFSHASAPPFPQSPAVPPTPPQQQLPAPEDPDAPKTGLQRAIQTLRVALPFVQKLLPLLDGNFATAVGALLAPQHMHHAPTPPPQVKVDLEPVERGLAELRAGQRDLRTQVQEQVTSLKRVEDHLERVREATDRNTLEQQELVEDLRAVGSRMSNFAIIGLILLALSVGLNIYFLVQLQHILR